MRRLAFLLVLIPSIAVADGDPRCEQAAKPSFRIEKRGGEKIVKFEAPIIICQKVPRPSVAIVPVPKQINYAWEDLKQDFLPKVQASVTKAPF